MSGIDMALCDVLGKATGWPLYKLLGGAAKAIPAYAGGVALGWQDPSALVDEAAAHVEAGYKALKLRLGDTVERDVARVAAVRKVFGEGVENLTDVNAAYTLADARRAMPQLDALKVGWPEEPFPASGHKLPIHPHSSMTGINMAATLHVLAALEGHGCFEADGSRGNLFRDELVATPFVIGADGCVRPPERPGIGVDVDEAFLRGHPPTEGPAYA